MGNNKKTVDKKLVKHLASLAKLNLTDKEIDKYQNDLSGILEIMKDVKNLDLSNITDTFKTTDEINVFRDDIVTPSFTQEEALQNTKNKHNGYFLVPRILK